MLGLIQDFCNAKQALINLDAPANIFIYSPDSDVFVLGIPFWTDLQVIKWSSLWIIAGTADKRKHLGCHIASKVLGSRVSKILPAIHAFSGFDTTPESRDKKISSK